MFPTKLVKIVLPITTLTAATVITATLLFSKKEDIKLTNLNDEALQNYDKELEEYKEEIVKEEEEKKDSEDKPQDDSNKATKDKDKSDLKGPEKKTPLEELIKRKMDDGDPKETIQKLLNKPEELIDDILRGQEGIEKPSEAEIKEFLQRAPELAKELEKTKQEGQDLLGGKPQNEPAEEAGGLPPPKEESLQESSPDVPNKKIESQVDGVESETPMQQTPSGEDEKREEATLQSENQEPNLVEEVTEDEGVPKELGLNPLQEASEEEDDMKAREDDQTGDEDTSRSSETDEEGRGQKENQGGESDETIVDIDKLNWLGRELRGAMSALGIKLG